jgi:processing peptidase subunit beta
VLGLTILGSDENIKKMKKADLVDYIKKWYTTDRMVLVGAGGIDHDELCKLGEKLFSGVPQASTKANLPKAAFTGSEVRIRDDTLKDAHIAFAVEGVGWNHPDHVPLLVAQTIVGSWDRSLGSGDHLSSRLAQEVAAHQLADSFYSFNTTYSDTGLFGIYAIAPHREKLIDLTETVLKQWRRQCLNATEGDIYRAKNQLKTSLLFSLDSSVQVAEEIGRHLLSYGRRLSPFELDALIESVDAKKVREVTEKYLYDADPAVVGYGPIEALPDYTVVRQNMSDFFV